MFVLRKFFNDGGEANCEIGNNYTLVLKKRDQERFEESFRQLGIDCDPDIYGILSYGNGTTLFLYKGQRSYIMTENGTTFDNLSERY